MNWQALLDWQSAGLTLLLGVLLVAVAVGLVIIGQQVARHLYRRKDAS